MSDDAAPSLESRITAEEPAAEVAEVADAQNDGATPTTGGGGGLQEPEYDVEVKLADLQADPNNPLFSAKTFEDLNLYATLIADLAMRRNILIGLCYD